jgi:CheY-like chemotaxis protein
MLNHPVTVHSRQGRGSVFSITVPRVAAEELSPLPVQAQTPARRVSSLKGRHLLCIDNDAAILQGMVALLSNWQCQITAAENLHNAMTKLGSDIPDILLADYQLDDDKNGLDAMDMLRVALNKHLPGILITGYMAQEVRDDAVKRGYHVLYKPVKPAALRALVNKLLK